MTQEALEEPTDTQLQKELCTSVRQMYRAVLDRLPDDCDHALTVAALAWSWATCVGLPAELALGRRNGRPHAWVHLANGKVLDCPKPGALRISDGGDFE